MKKVFLNKNPLNSVMLNTVFLNGGGLVKKGQGGVIDDGYIRFKDPEVLRVLLANGVDTDGDGGITEEEASAVTSIGTLFNQNTIIETFDEFEKFTGVTMLINGKYIGGTDYYEGAFRACSSLLSIKLPDSIKTIGNGSFASCTSLKYVDIPNSVTNIKAYAFFNTPQLDFTIPEYVTTIEFGAFRDSGLSGDLYLPNLSGVIDEDATFQNTKITSISNLGAITEIGGWIGNNRGAFRNCTLLETVALPNTLTKIGDGPFYGCTALRECNIPSSVAYIGPSAFYNCTSLVIEDLSLPNLETLGKDAFYGVSIKKISNLGKITALPAGNTNTQNFGKKDALEEVVLPDTLTSIGDYAFYDYTTITSISANWGSITYIGVNSFQEVKGLPSSLSLPSLENVLKSSSFRDTNLEEVLDLGSITTVDNYAFYYALSLKKVVLPQTLTSIKMQAFRDCKALETVICHNATPPTLHAQAFMSTNSTFIIYVPDASVTAYREASNWSTYADRIKPLSEYTE